jgi:hypothetical protein
MINLNELRTGNWVGARPAAGGSGSEYLHEVVAIKETAVKLHLYPPMPPEFNHSSEVEPENLYGISLLESVLNKCGFDNLICKQNPNLELKAPANDKTDSYSFVVGGMCIITHLRYVHQLQNIYFAIMGEELQVRF